MKKFNQKYFDKYHKENLSKCIELAKKNGYIIEEIYEVDVNGWTALDDWMYGDFKAVTPGGAPVKSDLKTSGKFDAPVSLTQLASSQCKVEEFWFYDLLDKRVYILSMKKLRGLYLKGSWYQNPEVDDKKKGLIRFNRDLIIKNADIVLK